MPRLFAAAILLLYSVASVGAESQCFGTVSRGRIENSVPLPTDGPNFSSYSSLAASLGRTHVHAKVSEIILAAYAALAKDAPGTRFVYGETGWPSGGRIRPHRTHQNGLSVDFFVPVKKASGQSVALPTGPTNKFGYDIEFDQKARFREYEIDFAAIAEHLYQLDRAAKDQKAGLALVIFDNAYLAKLYDTPRGSYLRQNVNFMKGKPWVRHDEHYHVDFAIPCRPLSAG